MKTILVVDDATLMRRNLITILTQDGKYEVVGQARNGKEALLMYRDLKPDLVTMDITMPIMDGIEAVQRIREEFPDARIIMISALNQKNMVLKALDLGACNYIIKPVTKNKVITAVDKLFEGIGGKTFHLK